MKNPKLIVKPFAKNGQKNVIPENYETSMESNQATWDQGFGQITMLPVAAGGLPPKGQDFNGIFNQISENIVYLSQGGRFKFSAEYAEAIGGYPKGAILQSDDEKKDYLSLIDNNKVDFNTAPDISASWKLVNTDDLLAQIASKQPKGDYATKAELNSGLAGKQPVGDYATKTEVNSKLAKDQNGADIPDKETFIKNLGLGAAAKSNVVQGVGTSQTDVMSQKAVTDLAATKQAKGNYASGDIFQTIPGYTFMHSPEKKYRSVIGDDGIFRVIDNTNPLNPTTFSFGADGAMASGTIPAVRITGLFSRWLAVSGARAIGTKYTNSRLAPMAVAINFSFTAGDNQVFVDDGVNVTRLFDVGKSDATTRINIFFIVPPGAKYWVEGNIPFTTWSECY